MMELRRLTIEEIRKMLSTAPREALPLIMARFQQDARKGVQTLLRRYQKELASQIAEEERLSILWEKETDLRKNGYTHIAGLDEAGRGPLAGPVVAACVVLSSGCSLPGLNDSKQLTLDARSKLAELIKEQCIAWSIGICDHQEIDRINIYQATIKAMVKAVQSLKIQPDYLIIDALKLPLNIPQEGIVQGDCKCAAIAAASIIAKTYRDRVMDVLDQIYPQYGFKEHKGYATPRHVEAIRRYGPCEIHRQSFMQKIMKSYNNR
ncbi:MAG: ribonuclease HII [Bacillota bacterium]